jgi:hypothetical protein
MGRGRLAELRSRLAATASSTCQRGRLRSKLGPRTLGSTYAPMLQEHNAPSGHDLGYAHKRMVTGRPKPP